jgi:small subunit ribosomal protein S11
MATAKKSKRVVEAEGIAHVNATFNNTTITITDHLAGDRWLR